MKKEELKESIEHDVQKMRGAMLELISNNRELNKELVDQMHEADYSLLEEYGIISKGILDAAKILTDIHTQTPKILQEIEKVHQEKKKIDIQDLMND